MADTLDLAPLQQTLVSTGSLPGPVNVQLPGLADLGTAPRLLLGDSIGKGGMGEVRACVDTRLGRQMALKAVTSREGAAVERFIREARIQGQLEHPAVVPVHELAVGEDGAPYFTMKRVRGQTLAEVLHGPESKTPEMRARFSRRRLLAAFQSVCNAVDFAHSRGVVHRDIKPNNVMLGDFGEVYLLDWGLAKATGDTTAEVPLLGLPQPGEGATRAGVVMGTPGYMSPEQVVADPVTTSSDVWALGSMLFEIVSGELLVEPGDATAMMLRTRDGVDARVRTRYPRAEVPAELEAACVRATALDPRARPTARQLHDLVERVLAGERDEELRAQLATVHSRAAQAAAERVLRGDRDAVEQRRVALREVGQCLALDPGNRLAHETFLKLLATPPQRMPEEAEAEMQRSADEQLRVSSRAATLSYGSLLLFLPLLLMMGVRSGQQVAALFGLIVLTTAMTLAVWRRRTVSMPLVLAAMVVSALMISAVSFVAGAYLLVPGFSAVNTTSFVLFLPRRFRVHATVTGLLSVLLPVVATALGWLPEAYRFTPEGLLVVPQMLDFTPALTTALLVGGSLSTIFVSSLNIATLRDSLARAERQMLLQAWNLKQLLPS